MPRTKRARSPKSASKIKDTQQAAEVEAIKQKVQEVMQNQLDRIEEQMNAELEHLKKNQISIFSKFPAFLLDKTIKEIVAGQVSSQTSILSDTYSNTTRSASSTRVQNSTFKTGSRANSATRVENSTLSNNSTRMLTRKRSVSATYDASSESSHIMNTTTSTTNTGRRSRSRTVTKNTSAKPISAKPISRSLSRTGQKTTAYKTPAGKQPHNENGTITPKMKPNTPQVLLRRPKQGEVAVSYQGSPLMTGSCFREDVANINIPLPNGDLLSLLPEKGLRPSIMPDVGDDTRRQLEILRDNLIQVCSSMK